MRAHHSSQGLQQLLQQQPQQTQQQRAIRRVKSAPAMHDLVADVALELQIEAAIHAPAFAAGACFASTETFPAELVLPTTTLTEEEEPMRDLAACLASPPDGEVVRGATALRIGDEDAERRRSVAAVAKWMRVRARRKKNAGTAVT